MTKTLLSIVNQIYPVVYEVFVEQMNVNKCCMEIINRLEDTSAKSELKVIMQNMLLKEFTIEELSEHIKHARKQLGMGV